MYCIHCGVKLADSEKQCPLCGTVVFHPQLPTPCGEKPYPEGRCPQERVSRWGALTIVGILLLLPIVITLICDVQINGRISWSGYVVGAILLFYVVFVLPFWFKKPNPVIFVPVSFAAVMLYLLYISLATGGGWFLSMAFPVVGGLGLIVTAMVTLLRYICRGHLYIYGGVLVALGAFMMLVEFLINYTFGLHRGFLWCWYPMGVLAAGGIFLLIVAICRPLRETLHRKFFL